MNYLLNPTKNGLWILSVELEKNKGIISYIHQEIQKTHKKNKLAVEDYYLNRYIGSDADNIISFLRLFTLARQSLKSKNKGARRSQYNCEDVISKYIDLKKLVASYKEAYKIFKDEIYHKDFSYDIVENYLQKINKGYFIDLSSNTDFKRENRIILVSTEKSGLLSICNFLKAIGVVRGSDLIPLFSPEEKLYVPYFYFLDSIWDKMIDEQKIKELIKKSIDEYRDDNFPYSISNIGLIAEEYLTIIYESLFREQRPRNMPIGILYEAIPNKIKDFYGKDNKVIAKLEIDDLYKLIDNELAKKKIDSKDILNIIRKSLVLSQTEKSRIYNRINDIKGDSKISVFPRVIRENINELIRYRNSVSHKTIIPIGPFEALRAIYCCVTFITWWNETIKNINWELTKEEIIKGLVLNNLQKGIE